MGNATLLSEGAELQWDESDECYRLRADRTDELPSTATVAAVAEVTGTDPLELPPLRETIDPDALDNLFRETPGGRVRESGHVEFRLADHRVVVDASGEIEIHPPK